MFKNLAHPLVFPSLLAAVPTFTSRDRHSRAALTQSAQEWLRAGELGSWVSGPRALQTTVSSECSSKFNSTAASPNGEVEVGSSRTYRSSANVSYTRGTGTLLTLLNSVWTRASPARNSSTLCARTCLGSTCAPAENNRGCISPSRIAMSKKAT